MKMFGILASASMVCPPPPPPSPPADGVVVGEEGDGTVGGKDCGGVGDGGKEMREVVRCMG